MSSQVSLFNHKLCRLFNSSHCFIKPYGLLYRPYYHSAPPNSAAKLIDFAVTEPRILYTSKRHLRPLIYYPNLLQLSELWTVNLVLICSLSVLFFYFFFYFILVFTFTFLYFGYRQKVWDNVMHNRSMTPITVTGCTITWYKEEYRRFWNKWYHIV